MRRAVVSLVEEVRVQGFIARPECFPKPLAELLESREVPGLGI